MSNTALHTDKAVSYTHLKVAALVVQPTLKPRKMVMMFISSLPVSYTHLDVYKRQTGTELVK